MESLYARCQLYGIIIKREGHQFRIDDTSVESHLLDLYHQAGCKRHWAAVRYASSLLHHNVDSISPFITAVLVHGKQVSNIKNYNLFIACICYYLFNNIIFCL